jgi:flagellar biosynthetic protein FliR
MSYWLDEFHIFLLILLRVSALLIVAPIFGHRLFLARAKVGLAVMVSMVIFPIVDRFDVPVGFLPYAVMMVGEVIMGLVIGYAVLLLFIGIQFAGQLAGLQMGFGIVNVIDPASHDQVSIIGQFLNILAILLMLTLDGHHIILNGLMTSFDAVPLGGVVLKALVAHKMIALTAEVFVIAIILCATSAFNTTPPKGTASNEVIRPLRMMWCPSSVSINRIARILRNWPIIETWSCDAGSMTLTIPNPICSPANWPANCMPIKSNNTA